MVLLLYLFLLIQPLLSISGPIAPGPVVNPDGSPAFPINYRSTAQIILTCFTIVFASTWVCIHHHVPGYKTTQFQRWGLRARFLLNAILFPDKFVKRAFEQWMGCRLLYSDMERRITELGIAMDTPSGEPLLWTHVHAHFIQMGGIVFEEPVDPDEQGSSIIKSETAVFSLPPREGAGRRRFLDFREWDDDDIRRFLKLGLTKEQIQDRSKADGLAKAFVVIQCLWFVIQSIARAVHGLPVIELEVTCLAFIACNLGMYAFWWSKPLNVVCPITIERPPGRSHRQTATASVIEEKVSIRRWGLAIFEVFRTGDVGYLVHPTRDAVDFKTINEASKCFPVNYFYTSTGRKGDDELLKEWGFWIWLAYSVTPAVFGALHSIGWYSAFPSPAEELLWRASCIIPSVHALLWVTGFCIIERSRSSWWFRFMYAALGYFYTFVSSPVNLVARFAFVILPLLQFRDIPPLAHETVSWSDLLPHV